MNELSLAAQVTRLLRETGSAHEAAPPPVGPTPNGRYGSIAYHWREFDDPQLTGFTVGGPFRESTTYFAPSEKPFMFNFRVRNLDALLDRPREADIVVDDRMEEYAYGRFAWCMDPEGNRVELWEPR